MSFMSRGTIEKMLQCCVPLLSTQNHLKYVLEPPVYCTLGLKHNGVGILALSETVYDDCL